MSKFQALILLASFALAGASPISAADWSEAAVTDLVATHDIIRDNHPGAVDPLNAAFDRWLDRGERLLLPRARAVRSEHDYQRVLREYINGFADGHVNVAMTETESHLWPHFLVRTDGIDAPVRVSVLADPPGRPPGLARGDELIGCGGVPVRQMLRDRVLRPLLNPNVPQRLRLKSAWLMVVDADDGAAETPFCAFRIGKSVKTIRLRWRRIDARSLTLILQRSGGIDIPAIGIRKIDGVWLISLPTFAPAREQVARMRAMLAFVRAHAQTLHAARHVVIDLRGNDGGSDDWGNGLVSALWGDAVLDGVANSVSLAIDWRVSARNLASLRADANTARAEGQTDTARYFADLAAGMDRALHARQALMRESVPATGRLPRLDSPFTHPVYLLTTPHCASACLDFVDILDRLPGIIRAGLQTSSDTDYLETAAAGLPSGHATLHYPMKVFRGRPRAANASYAPEIPWPGGEMTDRPIARWMNTLP